MRTCRRLSTKVSTVEASRSELEALVGVSLDVDGSDSHGDQVINHSWRSERDLVLCGEIDESTAARLINNRLHRSIQVKCNRAVLDHDIAIVLGPVFPHEVVGLSGGNKCFFPWNLERRSDRRITLARRADRGTFNHWISRANVSAGDDRPCRVDGAHRNRQCLALVVLPQQELDVPGASSEAKLARSVGRRSG